MSIYISFTYKLLHTDSGLDTSQSLKLYINLIEKT